METLEAKPESANQEVLDAESKAAAARRSVAALQAEIAAAHAKRDVALAKAAADAQQQEATHKRYAAGVRACYQRVAVALCALVGADFRDPAGAGRRSQVLPQPWLERLAEHDLLQQ